MSARGYQEAYSSINPEMFSREGRERKALTLLAVLRDHFAGEIATLQVVNLGCSAGVMDGFIAPHVGTFLGLDIDAGAIDFARRNAVAGNLSYRVGDAMATQLPDACADVVICSQVYEHVPDPALMMREIGRILVPGGVCYFAATNRLCLIEKHYHLPFLSIMPVWAAHLYLRLLRRGDHYYERHLTCWGLRRLVRDFEIVDYTRRIAAQPEAFGADYMLAAGWRRTAVRLFLSMFYWASPGYIWLLRKR